MSKPLRTLASLFVLAALAIGSAGCWVRERRDDDHHDHEHHEHEEVIVR